MTPALKDALHRQRHTVFGHRRYWLHIGLWLLVLAACFPYAGDFSRGLLVGVNTSKAPVARVEGQPAKPISGKAAAGLTATAKDKPALVRDLAIGIVVGAAVVYFFLLWVIPYARYRQRKRVLLLALIGILVGLVGIVLGSSVAWGLAEVRTRSGVGGAPADFQALMHLILTGFLAFLIIAAFFSGYYFIDLYDQQKALNRYREVFAAKMQAETAFLKMQVNPHFLFNSLNNIYGLALTQSAQAPVVARRLQALLRYMLEECTHEMVPLTGELAFLKNYTALEQLRNAAGQVQIEYTVQGNPDGLLIAPLLLVNFIENAFKHGVKAGITAAEVRVKMTIAGRVLAAEIFNTKPPAAVVPENIIRESGGIGVQNVKRRLQILYPGRHRLRISETPYSHAVYLHLQL